MKRTALGPLAGESREPFGNLNQKETANEKAVAP